MLTHATNLLLLFLGLWFFFRARESAAGIAAYQKSHFNIDVDRTLLVWMGRIAGLLTIASALRPYFD
jgi:hypothetical protein